MPYLPVKRKDVHQVSRVPIAVPVQSLHGHTDQLLPTVPPVLDVRRIEGNKANITYRRTSQKPPAELYENFKSRFSGLAQNVSSAEDHPAEAGATALDDAPTDLPRYVLL